MRILYINCAKSNRPWGAECSVGDELRRRGHEVTDLDYRQEREDLFRLFADGYEKKVDPHVVFLQRGDGFPLSILKAMRAPIVYWATEVWWKEQHNPLLEELDVFRQVWVHDTVMHRLLSQRSGYAPENVSVLSNGFDERLFSPGPVPTEGRPMRDVLFYGSLNARRLGLLRRLKHLDVNIVTNQFGERVVDAIRRSKIVLNLHFGEARDLESRVFETLGAGACLVTEPLAEQVEELGLKEDVHYASAGDARTLVHVVTDLLENESQRASLARHGHEEAMARHTWRHRCHGIEERLQEVANEH